MAAADEARLGLRGSIATVATSAVVCTLMRLGASMITESGALGTVDAPASKVGAMAVSTFHALCSSLHALYMVRASSTLDDFGERFGVETRVHCLAELGYYVYDTLASVRGLMHQRRRQGRAPGLLDLGFLIHHVPPLAGFALVSAWWPSQSVEKFNSTAYLTCMFVVVNITTPLQNLRWLMERSGVKITSPAYRANQIVFIVLFTLLRILGVYWLIRALQWLRDLPKDISTVDLVRHHLPLKCVVGTAVLYAVNVVWWGMNMRKLAATFSGKGKRA